WLPTRFPKHYCAQFHAKYNEENLDELVAAEGANDWVNLMQTKCAGVEGEPIPPNFRNADMPTLYPWKFTTAYGEGTQVVAERNPYYWKVDTEGRQLPYIDRVVLEILEDREVLLLKVLNGEVDMMSRHFNTNDNKAVLADNMDAGEFGFFETLEGGNTTGLHFNLTHKDPRMREIFQNKDFRIAVSHCIDRQEIIDLIYVGQGEPMQSAMDRTSIPELFDEEMYSMYTEFDQDLAHEHLAAAGMTEQGDNGFFLGPDGEPFSFVIQATDSFGFSDRAEVIVQQLQACGLDAQLSVVDRSLLYQRKDANEHDVHVWGAGGSSSVFLDPRHFFPYSQESAFAQAWVTWYENPSGDGSLTQPEEPPAIVKQQMELYDQIKATGDYATQIELMQQIIEIAKDQFYVIGVSSTPPGYGIVKNNFHNVPSSMPGSWQYPTPAPTNPEQYWISSQ
ncbi:MAG: ABC transporter substrate-binding protein, partial [Caldilineaceae bacterium]|nr:ABC transporter substrate-binding protein [Caldilineaceae bacterium]